MNISYDMIISTLSAWGGNPGEIHEIVARLAENAAEYIDSADVEIADDFSWIEYRLRLTEAGKKAYDEWCIEHGYTPELEPPELDEFRGYMEWCRARGLRTLDGPPFCWLRVFERDPENIRRTLHDWRVLEELVTRICAELSWIGATDEAMGSRTGDITAHVSDDGFVVICDEAVEVRLTPSEAAKALEALRELPEGAGWGAAWNILDGITIQN